MPFSALRGFRDYPPPEAGARTELRRRMRAVARRAGFLELETPSIESLDLFKVKSGEEIGEQIWTFQDKGGRDAALVPETTPSLARVYVDRAKAEPLPVKWFTYSRLWRYEEPQAGRTREFGQFNLDILGVPGVEAEVELLSTAALVLDEIGAAGLYRFRINDREFAEGLGAALGATDLGRYFRALDRYGKISLEAVPGEFKAAGLSDRSVGRVLALLDETRGGLPPGKVRGWLEPWIREGLGEAGAAGARRLIDLLRRLEAIGLGDRVVFDPTIVRGLAYYTSTVFEAFDPKGDLRALFGGGRYDQLVELFGGPATPACGLAMGDQTLELLLKANARWPEGEPPLDTYVVAVTPEQAELAIQWTQRLRRAGVSADCDLLARSLSRQLKEADRRHARRALLLGPKELARGVVLERDLASGEQRERSPDEVLPRA
jgi:histidyl-tRNA synthetase